MKKLLETLYVSTPESYLFCRNENICVKIGGEEKASVPAVLKQESCCCYSGNGKYCFLRMGIIHDSAAISRSVISKFAQSFYEISLG